MQCRVSPPPEKNHGKSPKPNSISYLKHYFTIIQIVTFFPECLFLVFVCVCGGGGGGPYWQEDREGGSSRTVVGVTIFLQKRSIFICFIYNSSTCLFTLLPHLEFSNGLGLSIQIYIYIYVIYHYFNIFPHGGRKIVRHDRPRYSRFTLY